MNASGGKAAELYHFKVRVKSYPLVFMLRRNTSISDKNLDYPLLHALVSSL